MFKEEWQTLIQTIKKIDPSHFDELPSSKIFQNLLIAGEDHRFTKHQGVDYIALCRATWKTLIIGKREGGSTIAMQLVRVLTKKYDKTLSRKLLEIYLARRLTEYLSKNKITSLYLTVAYFGWEMNGLKETIRRLDLDPYNLNLYDIAGIIARLKYPEPKIHSQNRSKQIEYRTEYILKRYRHLNLGLNNECI